VRRRRVWRGGTPRHWAPSQTPNTVALTAPMGHLPVMSAKRCAFATLNYAAPPHRFTTSGSMAQTTQTLAPSLQEFTPVIRLSPPYFATGAPNVAWGYPKESTCALIYKIDTIYVSSAAGRRNSGACSATLWRRRRRPRRSISRYVGNPTDASALASVSTRRRQWNRARGANVRW
jgi:hypothetical protein